MTVLPVMNPGNEFNTGTNIWREFMEVLLFFSFLFFFKEVRAQAYPEMMF